MYCSLIHGRVRVFVCVCCLWEEMGAAGFEKECNPWPWSCHRPRFHLTCPFPHESVCLMSPGLTPTHLFSHLLPFLMSPLFLLLRIPLPATLQPPTPPLHRHHHQCCHQVWFTVHLPLSRQHFFSDIQLTASLHVPTHFRVGSVLCCCGGRRQGGVITGVNLWKDPPLTKAV